MKKVVSLLSMLVLFSALAFGQARTVTGVVRDAQGNPVPFATVTEQGTNNATRADENGRFTFTVNSNNQIVVSAAGYTALTVGQADIANISLQRSNEQLSEVVVTTAFGVKREARITPYSAQVIGEEQLKIIPQTNVNNALAGKVAGVQFRGQSPIKLNDQGFLRIRGGSALTSEPGALYVVDGTPVNSFDVNPDDISDITILKGANATALFGSRAANGAVVITTKKRGDRNTAGVEFSQGVTFDRVYILPEYQNLYAGGSTPDLIRFQYRAGMPAEFQQLNGKFYHDFTDDASWGPRMAGQPYLPWYSWIPGSPEFGKEVPLTARPDNARDFWNTGVTNVTNASFSKGGEGYNFRLSYTNNSIRGMLPESGATRNTVFTSGSVDLGARLVLSTNLTYTANRINGVFDDGYANNSSGSFNQWFHRELDMDKMREYKNLVTPIGTYASWNFAANPDAGTGQGAFRGNYWYNPYTYYDNIDQRQDRDRLFGDVALTFSPHKNFRIRGTLRKNALNTTYENITRSILERSASQTGLLASYGTGQTRNNEMNYEVLASYNNRFIDDKLNLSLNAGGNLLQVRYNDATFSTSGGLNVPDFYAISNSKNPINFANDRQRQEVRSGFTFGDLEWNRIAALNFAVRTDYYSTGAAGNNQLTSPSLGASVFFSEFTRDAMPWLSYGKVFASWGKKPLPLGVYQNNFLYSVNPQQFSGNFLMSTPNTFISPGVSGALVTTYEAGLDLKFVRNRYGFNLTYYDETSANPPVTVAQSATTGFTSTLINATRIEKRGIELQLTASPFNRRDFDWTINKTFGYLIANPVVELLPGQDRITFAGGAFGTRFARVFQELGKDWGQLIGGGIARNEDGLPLLNSAGLFVRDAEKHWGSVIPKVTGGLVNTLTYKNFTANFNIDYQVGGKFFSLSEQWGHYSGLMAATAATNDKGNNVRDAIANGGGVHVVGVSSADNRTPVDMYVDAQTYFHQFYNAQIAEPFIHSLTFVKLREISLGYVIPVSQMSFGRYVKGATLSVVARNPLLIYRETESFDPSEISGVQGEDGQYPGTRALGFNLRLNF